MKNDYFIDVKENVIQMPDSRWYEITKDKVYPSVTSILSVKNKQGLTTWQVNLAKQGIDAKAYSRQVMDNGSVVHNAAENLMKGFELTYLDNEGNEIYDFWNEWLPITRFAQAYKEFEIKPILIEQVVWSNRMKVAGRLDLLANIVVKGKKHLAVIDLKRGASAFTDYHWQISAYKDMLNEMLLKSDKDSIQVAKYLKANGIDNLNNASTFILLLNTPTKKGYRMTEVTNNDKKLKSFEACNMLFREVYPNLKYIQKQYPLTLKL